MAHTPGAASLPLPRTVISTEHDKLNTCRHGYHTYQRRVHFITVA